MSEQACKWIEWVDQALQANKRSERPSGPLKTRLSCVETGPQSALSWLFHQLWASFAFVYIIFWFQITDVIASLTNVLNIFTLFLVRSCFKHFCIIPMIRSYYRWPSWRTLRSRSCHRDQHQRDPSKTVRKKNERVLQDYRMYIMDNIVQNIKGDITENMTSYYILKAHVFTVWVVMKE